MSIGVIMGLKVISRMEKKVVKWGEGYVIFITPEAKRMGLNDKSKVNVSLVEDAGKKKIVIEK